MSRETAVTVLEMQPVLRQINLKVESLEHKSTLAPLKTSDDSVIKPRSACMDGTRQHTLSKVVEWIIFGKEPVLWLSGVAGCGKSSIMGSLSDLCLKMGSINHLAAFIRFDHGGFNDASLFVSALAYQIAKIDGVLQSAIAGALAQNQGILSHTQISEHWNTLLQNPLSEYSKIHDSGPVVVLVDALDECAAKSDNSHAPKQDNPRKQLLRLITSGFTREFPFIRFIITSRPEDDIRIAFTACPDLIHHIPLDISSPETVADIRHFLKTSLDEVADEDFIKLYQKDNNSALQELSQKASGLFIWASVVADFLKSSSYKRLQKLLASKDHNPHTPQAPSFIALTTLYKTALGSIVGEDDRDIKEDINTLLCFLIVLGNIGESDLGDGLALMGIHNYDELLGKIGSLLIKSDGRNRFGETQKQVGLLHKSLVDFLVDESASGAVMQGESWYIDFSWACEKLFVAHAEYLHQSWGMLLFFYLSMTWQ
ncbi:hypothetical protein VKT23_020124 [Stygiomarasmius scandens]|uniref:Nephrocystin 3-like N-terminal domain-containing protein n=1 Tax=Marasmiellus scandens TaxID=2682957 RepID=A0ABR1INM8_9AGAR